MRPPRYLAAAVSLAAVALAAVACTPAEDAERADATAAGDADTRTVVETREVPVPTPPVVVDREVPVPVPTPPVVVDRREGDSTTIRANEKGLEVETTNR